MITKNDDGYHVVYEKCSCGREDCITWFAVGDQLPETENNYLFRIFEDKDNGLSADIWLNRNDIGNLIEDLKNLLAVSG